MPLPESRRLGQAISATRETELWIWTLGEGERYPSEAGSGDWHEMLLILEGTLVVETADCTHEVSAGDFLIFSSGRPYVFANALAESVRFIRSLVF